MRALPLLLTLGTLTACFDDKEAEPETNAVVDTEESDVEDSDTDDTGDRGDKDDNDDNEDDTQTWQAGHLGLRAHLQDFIWVSRFQCRRRYHRCRHRRRHRNLRCCRCRRINIKISKLMVPPAMYNQFDAAALVHAGSKRYLLNKELILNQPTKT